MIVTFDKSFSKSLDKIGNTIALKNTSKAIEKCEKANNILEIPNLKNLKDTKIITASKLAIIELVLK